MDAPEKFYGREEVSLGSAGVRPTCPPRWVKSPYYFINRTQIGHESVSVQRTYGGTHYERGGLAGLILQPLVQPTTDVPDHLMPVSIAIAIKRIH